MARKFRLSVPTGLLIGGAVVLGGAFLLFQNPNIINSILHPGGSSTASQPVAGAISSPAPAQGSIIQPPLSQIEGGHIIPFQQNVFCDPTLGYNWNPLTGRCEQNLQSSSGRCAPGSHFDHCQCQCVPNSVFPQPACYRDCMTSCTDKINQSWSWCQLGCIPKSAIYGNPRIAACPPL